MTPQEQLITVLQGTIGAVADLPDARPTLFFDPTTATYQSINTADPQACAGVYASQSLIMVMPLRLIDLRAWAESAAPVAAAEALHAKVIAEDYDPWNATLADFAPEASAAGDNGSAS